MISKVQGCRRGRMRGLVYRKKCHLQCGWMENGQSTQDAAKLVGGGGWKGREFLKTSRSAEKE